MKANTVIKMILLFCLYICLNSKYLYSQFDTEFWFAAPEVSVSSQNFDKPIYLWITSSNATSQVTVTQPANPSFAAIIVSLNPFSTTNIDLTPWLDIIENKPADQILNYGLKITATNPVNVYYEVVSLQCLCNPEIFTLKGRNALGQNFYIPMQNYLDNANYSPTPYSAFEIIATENNTSITITPSNNIVGHSATTPFTIVLNEGQTYSATATSQAASAHLNGSYVSSDKPIAITIKDDLLNGAAFGGCADLAGDQLIPLNMIGTKYIVVRGFLNAPYDKAFILATQNNTSVFINGILTTTIDAGQTYMYSIGTANAAYIETSTPAYVLHLSGFGCEVGISILPSIECTGSSSVTFTRSTNDPLHITLLVKQGGENNFLLNGASGIINGSSFADVPSTGGLWKYAQLSFTLNEIPSGIATQISNTTELFHLGMIHGTGSGGCRFGFFSDYASYNFQINANKTTFCEGDTLILQSNIINGASYNWTGPNGFTAQGQSIQIDSVIMTNSGYYYLNGDVGNCNIKTDSIYIEVFENPIVNITPSTIDICLGNSVNLNANSNITGVSYLWAPSIGLSDTTIATPIASPTVTTTYIVTVSNNICKNTDDVIVNIHNLSSSFNAESPICLENTSTITYTGNASSTAVYYWDFDGGTVISGSGSGPYEIKWDTAGTYNVSLYVDDPFCNMSPTSYFDIEVIDITSSISGTDPLCFNSNDGSVNVSANSGQLPYSYLWSPGAYTSSNVNNLSQGHYSVTITDANGCIDTNSITLNSPPAILLSLLPTNASCSGDCNGEIQLNVSGGTPDYSYVWNTNPPQYSSSAINLCEGLWKVTVTDENNCSVSDSINISINTFITAVANANPTSGYAPAIINFQYTGIGATSFYWDFGDGQTSNDMNPTHTYTSQGIYNVLLIVNSGYPDNCEDSIYLTIDIKSPSSVFIPNVFTPNNDGQNDVFKVKSQSLEQENMIIFNRWGNKIYEWNSVGGNWDGQNSSDGTYFYIYNAKGLDGIEYNFNGIIELFRGE